MVYELLACAKLFSMVAGYCQLFVPAFFIRFITRT